MIQIEESNPSFESCNKCIHSDDSEEMCILRQCIHAVAQLKECYVPKQRKKGMWIEHNPHKWGLGIVFECSECGEKIDCEPSNYCPNCGAEMEDPEDIPMEYFESGGR